MENFNFKRFWNVFKYEFEKIRLIYIVMAVMAGSILAITYSLLMLLPQQLGDLQQTVYTLNTASRGFMFAGVIFSSMMFGFAGLNKTMIPDMLLPASIPEKFWAKFLVYWLIPALFAFVLNCMPYRDYTADFQEFYEFSFVKVWHNYRLLFCIYLCISGIMLLGGAIYFKYAAPKTFGTVIGITTFVILTLVNFVKRESISTPDWLQNFGNYISAENYRITIFQLVLGFSVVTICTAIAYHRFKRLTLKK